MHSEKPIVLASILLGVLSGLSVLAQAPPAAKPPSAEELSTFQVSVNISAGDVMGFYSPGKPMVWAPGTTASVALTESWASGVTQSKALQGKFVGQVGGAVVFRTSDGLYFVARGGTAYPSLLSRPGTTADLVIADWRKDFRRSVMGAIHGKSPATPEQQVEWCDALGELPIQEAPGTLRGYLQSPNVQVRAAAKNGLANWTKLSRLLSQPAAPAKPK
ncbi:MAG: hypothetical protein P4N24_04700 [Acidobacteriota bacterium]|nr:hypothetical protein [Acidobacteriota bacterium]